MLVSRTRDWASITFCCWGGSLLSSCCVHPQDFPFRKSSDLSVKLTGRRWSKSKCTCDMNRTPLSKLCHVSDSSCPQASADHVGGHGDGTTDRLSDWTKGHNVWRWCFAVICWRLGNCIGKGSWNIYLSNILIIRGTFVTEYALCMFEWSSLGSFYLISTDILTHFWLDSFMSSWLHDKHPVSLVYLNTAAHFGERRKI